MEEEIVIICEEHSSITILSLSYQKLCEVV